MKSRRCSHALATGERAARGHGGGARSGIASLAAFEIVAESEIGSLAAFALGSGIGSLAAFA
jgi:hypothetical protein